MRSYLSVDRIENDYAVCELELIDIETSRQTDPWDRETQMVDIPIQFLNDVNEGDILQVEHCGEVIERIIGIDMEEKRRRVEILARLGF